jgi:hypothetical protein
MKSMNSNVDITVKLKKYDFLHEMLRMMSTIHQILTAPATSRFPIHS